MRNERFTTLRRPFRPNVARASSPPPATVPARVGPKEPSRSLIAVAIYWLVFLRVIIPGFFDYDPNLDMLAVADKYATFSTITWLTFLFVPCFLLMNRMGQVLEVLRSTNRWYLLMVVFATVSYAWSIEPHSTLSRLSRLFAINLDCLAIVLVGWNAFRVQQVTRPILTLLLVGSLIFGIVSPDLAITPPIPPDTEFYWHGLASQKNGLGALAALGALFWFHGWVSREVKWFPALCGWLVSFACLVLSRSATSVMATAFASVLMFMLARPNPAMRRYMPYIITLFAIVVLAYACAVLKLIPALDFLLTPITAVSGKDLTFSGRTQIWEIIREHIQHAPILGTGYGGYWIGPVTTSPSYVFVRKMFFYPVEAHNGYLDTINDLGYVGLVVLIGYIIVFITQSLRLWRMNRTLGALFIALMFQQMIEDLSETHWFVMGNDFIVLTLSTFALARCLMQESAARPKAVAPARPKPVAPLWQTRLR